MQTPDAIAALPKDQRGYPIPFFVYRPEDGAEPDLRIADVRTKRLCHRKQLCWVCGRKLGETIAYLSPFPCLRSPFLRRKAAHAKRTEDPRPGGVQRGSGRTDTGVEDAAPATPAKGA